MADPEEDEARYRDVPPSVSKELANACWEFGDSAHWTIEDLETSAKLVFNARLFDDPAEWHRRLSEAGGHLDNVQTALAQLRERLQRIETMAPKR